MGFAHFAAPVATTNGNDGELGRNDSAANGGGDFLRALHAQSNMSVVITDSDESLETGTLTGTSLLLDGRDLQDFVLEAAKQTVDDFVFLKIVVV